MNQLDLFGFPEPSAAQPVQITAGEMQRPSKDCLAAVRNEAPPAIEAPVRAPASTVTADVPVAQEKPISILEMTTPVCPSAVFVQQARSADVAVNDSTLPAEVMTLEEHANLFARITDGETLVEADEVRASFERLIRDVGSVKAALGKFKVADLLKRVTSGFVRDTRKAAVIDCVVDSMLTAFAFVCTLTDVVSIQGFTFDDRMNSIRRMLKKLDAEQLAAYRGRYQAQRAERIAQLQARVKAVKSPETLEEFDVFIRVKGEAALAEEMRARRDELVAAKLRSDEAARKAECSTVAGVELSTEMQIVETKHTRDGHDLFVVKLADRVERSKFDELSAATKRLGGYYSRFRGNGAVPGFQFKSRDLAEQLLAVGRGETVSATPAQAEREAAKGTSAAVKLKALATRTLEAGEKKLHQDRLTNTPKRARQASSAQEDARKEIALAQTMFNLADAIASGEATHLEKLTDKAQVVMFESILASAKYREISKTAKNGGEHERRRDEPVTLATIEYVEYPVFNADASLLSRLIRQIGEKPGLMRISAKLKPYELQAVRSGDDVVVPEEIVRTIFEKLGSDDSDLPYYWTEKFDRRKRLERMGIVTPEQFRSSCRQFLQYRQQQAKADKATELERALVGAKVGVDFYPTPKPLCAQLVEMLKLQPGMRVLEPSAGNGNIAEALRAAGYEPDCIELSSQLREVLQAKGFSVVGHDFLDCTEKYDALCMNPPFGGGSDMKHVRHAYSLLNQGGRLVSIVGEGAFFRSDAQATAFREWLDEVGAEVQALEQSTFTDRTLLQTTGANARVVTIFR